MQRRSTQGFVEDGVGPTRDDRQRLIVGMHIDSEVGY